MLDVTDVVVTFLKPMEIFWQMLFAIYYGMADVIAIVADVNATIFVCGRWNHIRYLYVADVIATL